MEVKKCRRCGKVLPHDYRYPKCEYCRRVKAERTRNIGLGVGAASATVIAAVVHLIKRGKK